MTVKRITQAVLGLVLLATALLAAQTPAAAATQGPYVIQGLQSSKCVDNPNSSPSNNVTMVIWNCHGWPRSANQAWDFVDTDPDYYNIRNRASGKCLTVLNNQTRDNAPVIQYTCNRGDNEEWDAVYERTGKNGHDYYTLRNRHSHKCLTVQNVSTRNGAKLLQFACNRADNQLWTWLR